MRVNDARLWQNPSTNVVRAVQFLAQTQTRDITQQVIAEIDWHSHAVYIAADPIHPRR